IGLWHRAVQLWSAPTTTADASKLHLVSNFIGHTQIVSTEAFNADTTLLASTSPDGMAKIWDVAAIAHPARGESTDESRRCLATLLGHAGEAYATVFLPPPMEHHLAVGYRDGSVHVWDLQHYDRHIAGQLEYQRALRAAG